VAAAAVAKTLQQQQLPDILGSALALLNRSTNAASRADHPVVPQSCHQHMFLCYNYTACSEPSVCLWCCADGLVTISW